MSAIKVKMGGYIREIASEEELIAMAMRGEVVHYDPVFLPRMNRWAHAEEIPELVEALAEGRRRNAERRAELAARPWWKKLWARLRGRE